MAAIRLGHQALFENHLPFQEVTEGIRRLLIIGAMPRLNWLGARSVSEVSWLSRMLARKPKMLVAIALANKMARQIWAMLTKHEDYKNPELAGSA